MAMTGIIKSFTYGPYPLGLPKMLIIADTSSCVSAVDLAHFWIRPSGVDNENGCHESRVSHMSYIRYYGQ